MPNPAILQELKQLYTSLVDNNHMVIKPLYQEAKAAFLKKERGIFIEFTPPDPIKDRVMVLYGMVGQ